MPALLLDELSNSQVEEIGGHFRRLLERDSLLVPLPCLGFDRHVRDDGEVSVSFDSNLEHCLERRMVHARENLASLNRFQMCGEDVAVPVRRLVKSGEIVGDFATKFYF